MHDVRYSSMSHHIKGDIDNLTYLYNTVKLIHWITILDGFQEGKIHKCDNFEPTRM